MAYWLVLNSDILVSEFELQSCYYVHFPINTLEKIVNPLILQAYELNSTTSAFLQGWLWHWITNKVWYAIKQKKKTHQKI